MKFNFGFSILDCVTIVCCPAKAKKESKKENGKRDEEFLVPAVQAVKEEQSVDKKNNPERSATACYTSVSGANCERRCQSTTLLARQARSVYARLTRLNKGYKAATSQKTTTFQRG